MLGMAARKRRVVCNFLLALLLAPLLAPLLALLLELKEDVGCGCEKRVAVCSSKVVVVQ
jgi:hypothetical protein